jgi:DNA-directed RNA polymerase III subunit RPC8
MFVVSEIKDIVRVPPSHIHLPRHAALTDQINIKYANRILHNVGLVIRVFDLLSSTPGTVFACQDGSYTATVHFRLLVFRPWVGEVLQGTIAGSSEEGLKVSLDFFQDIMIPSSWMTENSYFSKEEGLWIWPVEGEEGEMVKMSMEQGDTIRCRVESLVFNEAVPVIKTPQSATAGNPPGSAGPNAPPTTPIEPNEGKVSDAPFYLMCSINDAGLGCVSWWEE